MGRLLLVALSALSWAMDGSHDAPTPSLARTEAIHKDRQNVLAEMWRRRLLSPEASAWSAEDRALLERMRRAEAAGALTYVKKKFLTLRGFSVESKNQATGFVRIWFTREGFERYLRAKSLDAVSYFESRGVDAKWAFKLQDASGRPLFGPDGLLTDEGDAVFTSAAAGAETLWRLPGGQTFTSRRRKPR